MRCAAAEFTITRQDTLRRTEALTPTAGAKLISQELNQLGEQFSINCQHAQTAGPVNSYPPKSFNLSAEELPSIAAAVKDEFVFPRDWSGVMNFLTHCKDRRHREKHYKTYHSSARPGDSGQNPSIAQRIIAGRNSLAQLLGYENFFAYAARHKMIKDPRRIDEFMAGAESCIKARYEKNFKRVSRQARRRLGIKKLEPWDYNYAFYECMRQITPGPLWEFREFFELTAVRNFMLRYFEKLFSVRFDYPDHKNAPDRFLLFDLQRRKYLALIDFNLSHSDTSATKNFNATTIVKLVNIAPLPVSEKFPHITVQCDFCAAVPGEPILLTIDQLAALFHEMGHVFENAYTASNLKNFPNPRTESDTDEFYGIFMENLIFDWEFMRKMSAHYRTGKKISKRLFKAMVARHEFSTAENWREISLISRKELKFNSGPGGDLTRQTDETERELLGTTRSASINLFYELSPNIFSNVSGMESYVCNYYSFILGKCLSDLVFARFKNNRSLFSPGLGDELRNKIYAQRGRRAFFDSICDFIGADEIKLQPENICRIQPRRGLMEFFNLYWTR